MSINSESAADGAKPPTPKKRLKLIIAVAGVVAAVIIGSGLWFGGVLSPHKARPVESATSSQPIFIETPEMVTNLDAGPHRLSFVKIQCKIEVAHSSDIGPMTAAMPRVIDMIQTYLRETRPEELRSDAGTYRLREALLLRASLASTTAEVKDVLFEELIVQ